MDKYRNGNLYKYNLPVLYIWYMSELYTHAHMYTIYK